MSNFYVEAGIYVSPLIARKLPPLRRLRTYPQGPPLFTPFVAQISLPTPKPVRLPPLSTIATAPLSTSTLSSTEHSLFQPTKLWKN